MPRSMSSRQTALLESGFLDLNGEDRSLSKPVTLDNLTNVLVYFAGLYIETAQDKLNKADRVSSGGLSDSIVPTKVIVFGKTISIDIKIADYYKFVDEGVRGWADEKGGNSPYQFKKGGIGPNSPMVKSIRKWVIKEGLKGKGKENAKGSLRDRKRNSIQDTSTKTAIAISQGIRKKGLKPSHFWRDTKTEMRAILEQELGKALKIDIIQNLTQ